MNVQGAVEPPHAESYEDWRNQEVISLASQPCPPNPRSGNFSTVENVWHLVNRIARLHESDVAELTGGVDVTPFTAT